MTARYFLSGKNAELDAVSNQPTVLVRHGQRAARVLALAVVLNMIIPAMRQNQRASKLATRGAKPLEWVGIRVKSLKEAGETILAISRRSSKLSCSTNDAEGARAGESSYAVGANVR